MIEEKEIDVSTKLFVTLAADAATVTEEHRAQRIGWCLDNQFEYIQIDKSNPVEGTMKQPHALVFSEHN